jgi:hypothetical protein
MKITAGAITLTIRSGGDESVDWDLTRLIGAAAGGRDGVGDPFIVFPSPFGDILLREAEDLEQQPGKRERVRVAIEYFIASPVTEKDKQTWH